MSGCGILSLEENTMADEFEKRYRKNLKRLKERPVRTSEPHNPGPSFAQFVEIVAGMGDRAQIHGTVIRRLRKEKDA